MKQQLDIRPGSFNFLVSTKIHILKRKSGGLWRKWYGFKSGRMRKKDKFKRGKQFLGGLRRNKETCVKTVNRIFGQNERHGIYYWCSGINLHF